MHGVSCTGMTWVLTGWTVLSVKFSNMVQRNDVPDRGRVVYRTRSRDAGTEDDRKKSHMNMKP